MFATMERLIINHVLRQVKPQSAATPAPKAETENRKSVKDRTELLENYANGV